MSESIDSGGLIVKDPNAIRVYQVDYDQRSLATDVEISTSSWSVTGPDNDLTLDEASIVAGNRKTQIRMAGGTLNKRYTVTNRVLTDETPAQTIDTSFFVLIQQK